MSLSKSGCECGQRAFCGLRTHTTLAHALPLIRSCHLCPRDPQVVAVPQPGRVSRPLFASLCCSIPNIPLCTVAVFCLCVASHVHLESRRLYWLPFVSHHTTFQLNVGDATLVMNQIVQVDAVKHDTDPDAAYAETVAKGVV